MTKNGFYWFTSERSLNPTIGQHINGEWYLINEEGSVSLGDINRRGWDLHGLIKGQHQQFPKIGQKSLDD